MIDFTYEEDPLLTMYSTSSCGHCHRLRAQLDRQNIAYETVDIEKDPGAAEYVMSVNGGDQTVPTVRFPDGSSLTNPGLPEIRARMVRLALG